MFVVVIPSVDDQSIGKIDGGHMRRRGVYRDANGASEEAGWRSQSREEGFGVGSGDLSSPPLLSLHTSGESYVSYDDDEQRRCRPGDGPDGKRQLLRMHVHIVLLYIQYQTSNLFVYSS